MRRAAINSLRFGALLTFAGAFSLLIAWIAALPTFTPPATPPIPNWVDVDTSMCWAIGKRAEHFGRTDWPLSRFGHVTPFQLLSWKDVPLPERARLGPIRSMNGPGGCSGHIRISGWPMRCLWGAALNFETHHIVTPGFLATQLKSRGIDGGLPTGILWRGLAFNTLFFAALLWITVAAPRLLRRIVRRRRGRCAACGYDLRATPTASPCPECGAAPVTAPTTPA